MFLLLITLFLNNNSWAQNIALKDGVLIAQPGDAKAEYVIETAGMNRDNAIDIFTKATYVPNKIAALKLISKSNKKCTQRELDVLKNTLLKSHNETIIIAAALIYSEKSDDTSFLEELAKSREIDDITRAHATLAISYKDEDSALPALINIMNFFIEKHVAIPVNGDVRFIKNPVRRDADIAEITFSCIKTFANFGSTLALNYIVDLYLR